MRSLKQALWQFYLYKVLYETQCPGKSLRLPGSHRFIALAEMQLPNA